MTPSSEVTGHPPRVDPSSMNKIVTALAATLSSPPDSPPPRPPSHPRRRRTHASISTPPALSTARTLDRLNAEPDATCTAEYAPVTLTARGT
ncbi:hypothetical protein R1T08_01820 [Streptomyces sp. SBC-4]|nr:hypothetical protein [Streptomyces sp. SBC-4]MDV5143089.1 hypothetical protein [Streptomyces sp. SBC-4]